MTVALCVRCGALKWGAFNWCPECSFRPTSDLDLAYSLALSDHYFEREELEGIGERMKKGDPRPNLPPDQEEHFLRAVRDPRFRRMVPLGE